MALQTTATALMKCSFGTAPSSLMVLPTNKTLVNNKPAATINDHVPMLNIMPFAMCQSMANPMVAAATAAAMGVLTPMPCIPVTSAPWVPPCATVLINNTPAINNGAKLICNWGGVIEINFPGQATVNIP